MARIRLDNLLLARALIPSREKARAMIMAGEIQVNGQIIDKPGTTVDGDSLIEINSRLPQYVSRGGLKLEKAIEDFQLDFSQRVVLDIGASTGGYTDCALQHGAAKVFALDVGYGQLDWKLRNDPRVENLERKNIRYFSRDELGEAVDIITIDVSFISTTLLFPVIRELLREDGVIVTLIKPQFEAGRGKVGKRGVVRDPLVHQEVLLNCINAAQQEGLYCTALSFSPITGPKGNIEYFILLKKSARPCEHIEELAGKIVAEAQEKLGGKK